MPSLVFIVSRRFTPRWARAGVGGVLFLFAIGLHRAPVALVFGFQILDPVALVFGFQISDPFKKRGTWHTLGAAVGRADGPPCPENCGVSTGMS